MILNLANFVQVQAQDAGRENLILHLLGVELHACTSNAEEYEIVVQCTSTT